MSVSLLAGVMCACNDEDVNQITIDDTTLTNVEVTSFSLKSNIKIASNLDSVFFAIDLANGVIYNADSLPVGSTPGKAIVSVGLPTVSKAEFVSQYDGQDPVVVDYLTNSEDSVDLAADRVFLRVISADAKIMREYTIKLNVHTTKPDSLSWAQIPVAQLPGLNGATAQKTVKRGDTFYTLTTDATGAMLASGEHPVEAASWHKSSVTLPDGAKTETFTCTDDAFYIVDGDNVLNTSDDGVTWTSTGADMCYIYGVYKDKIVGVKKNGSSYTHVTYPASVESAVAADCPVSATSDCQIYSTKWSSSDMMTITGGLTADGSLSGSTWGFDGTKWANLSVEAMPGRAGIIVCNYYEIGVSSTYKVSTSPALYAFGGRYADGTIDPTVYVSVDRGVHWAKGDAYLQNGNIPLLFGAQAIVSNVTYGGGDSNSRAVAPVSQWECPYIYIFGGERSNGTRFNKNIFAGVINYFAMKPVI